MNKPTYTVVATIEGIEENPIPVLYLKDGSAIQAANATVMILSDYENRSDVSLVQFKVICHEGETS